MKRSRMATLAVATALASFGVGATAMAQTWTDNGGPPRGRDAEPPFTYSVPAGHPSARVRERIPAKSKTDACWHTVDPDRGGSNGFGYWGPGPC